MEDITLECEDIINLFKKTDLIGENVLSLEDIMNSIEKYFSPETKLQNKLSYEIF